MPVQELKESTEHELEKLESDTERVEHELEEVERAIEALEAAMQRLESGGDDEVAAGLSQRLVEREQEKARIQNEARRLAGDLKDARSRIVQVDKWNEEARTEVTKLEGLGEDVGDAQNRIYERERWVETQSEREKELEGRLEAVIGGYG